MTLFSPSEDKARKGKGREPNCEFGARRNNMYTHNHTTPCQALFAGSLDQLNSLMDTVLDMPGVKAVNRHTRAFDLTGGVWDVTPVFYARATRAQRAAVSTALESAVRQ